MVGRGWLLALAVAVGGGQLQLVAACCGQLWPGAMAVAVVGRARPWPWPQRAVAGSRVRVLLLYRIWAMAARCWWSRGVLRAGDGC